MKKVRCAEDLIVFGMQCMRPLQKEKISAVNILFSFQRNVTTLKMKMGYTY
jgi:hypothetical protein